MRQENELNQQKTDAEIAKENLAVEKVNQDANEQHREREDRK